MKKVISLFLSVMMLFSITAGIDFSAYATVYTGSLGGESVAYTFDDETGTLTISGKGDMREGSPLIFRIKNDYNLNVTDKVKTVKMTSTVTSICERAFTDRNSWGGYSGMKMLSATIGSGVKSIGVDAFRNCSKLSEIIVPDACDIIGHNAFRDCYSLETVHLGSEVKTLGNSVFYGDNKLININFPDNLESIGSQCFYHCSSLDGNIVLQNKLASIGTDAFKGCSSLDSITIMNPDCVISQSNTTIPLSIAIKGHIGSTAQEYAETFGNEFIPICSEKTKKVEPNCTEQGYTLYICEDCGRSFKTDYIEPLGHNYSEYVSNNDATYEKDGTKTAVCMNCGVTDTIDDVGSKLVKEENFKIKTVSLSLESSITMNYKVLKTAVAEFENPYIEFTRNGKTTTVTECTEQGDYYVFSYRDIAPQAMNDNVQAVLYATYNSVLYNSEPVDYSVSAYAYSMLERCSSNQYARLRTLLVDLLNYGAAAQVYQNYKTNDLVNAKLTDTQKSWASSQQLNLTNVTDKACDVVENPAVEWKSVGLNLNDSVAVRYKFSAENADDINLRITCGTSEWVYDSKSFQNNGDGTYTFVFNDLNADKMQKDIYITAMSGDTAASNTMRYSIESYAKQIQDAMPNSNLKKLTDAMMRYGISASNYA